jgi:hypothetical protein
MTEIALMRIKYVAALLLVIWCTLFLCLADGWAGPPFVTDDPEPVDFQHWEIFFGTIYNRSGETYTGTAPLVDANYGIAPETQLTVVAPLSYASRPGRSFDYGPGDVNIGVKYRFVNETSRCPQIAIFPQIVFPTGDSSEDLGAGVTSVLKLPSLQR